MNISIKKKNSFLSDKTLIGKCNEERHLDEQNAKRYAICKTHNKGLLRYLKKDNAPNGLPRYARF